MTFADIEDVEDRLGTDLDPGLNRLVETRLKDAEGLIRRRIKDLDEKVDSGDIREDDVIRVEAEAVLRVARNPEGYREESDGNYSYVVSPKLASGRLEILPEEWDLLGARKPGLFVLVPTFTMPGEEDDDT